MELIILMKRFYSMKVSLKLAVVFLSGLWLIGGCNSYKVRSLPYDKELKDVVVIKNQKVIVSDFLDVMIDEFNARSIKVRLAPLNYNPTPHEYVIQYDARQSWDLSPYLSDATIRVMKDNMTKANGKYHHIGGSCSFDIFTKWRGTEWKMKDIYDELLKNYPKTL